MLPGLWYPVSGGGLRVPGWHASLSSNNWNYSLLDGPYGQDLSDSLLYAAEVWGVHFFKFDFADFAAAVPGDPRPFETRYALGVERFVEMVARLKRSVPEAITIAHCGFARQDSVGRLGPGVPRLAADPAMLEVIDGFFSGDPQPTDLPATAIHRSSDLYQDIMVRAMLECGFPLARIEDHGAMCGLTNTCHRRGREGLRRSHIAQLARSGRRDLFYGDPSLPTDDDLAGMAAARRLFMDAWNRNLESARSQAGRRSLAWLDDRRQTARTGLAGQPAFAFVRHPPAHRQPGTCPDIVLRRRASRPANPAGRTDSGPGSGTGRPDRAGGVCCPGVGPAAR